MKLNRPNRNGVLAGVLFLIPVCTPFFVYAAASVVESRPVVESRSVESRSVENRSVVGSRVAESQSVTSRPAVSYRPPIEDQDQGRESIETQYQVQLLQQEVMELRGLVEEQRFEINRLKTNADERYLELDSRLQQILRTSNGQATLETSESPQKPVIEKGTRDEKSLYDTSLELIRNRQYDLAITQLQSLISRYPDGEYAPNAYYWLGEVYAAKPVPDLEKARTALAQVISFFPDHRKVPDATFKLGKVHYLLGDCTRAKQILEQVISRNEGKSVAKLAEDYLRDTVRCAN